MIDHVFRDPMIWNSEGPFLQIRDVSNCALREGKGYPHGMIDRWVLLQPSEAGHELCWGRVHPADMLE